MVVGFGLCLIVLGVWSRVGKILEVFFEVGDVCGWEDYVEGSWNI